MYRLGNFAVTTVRGHDRITFSFEEVNEETRKITNPQIQTSFAVLDTDTEIVNAIQTIRNEIEKYMAGMEG